MIFGAILRAINENYLLQPPPSYPLQPPTKLEVTKIVVGKPIFISNDPKAHLFKPFWRLEKTKKTKKNYELKSLHLFEEVTHVESFVLYNNYSKTVSRDQDIERILIRLSAAPRSPSIREAEKARGSPTDRHQCFGKCCLCNTQHIEITSERQSSLPESLLCRATPDPSLPRDFTYKQAKVTDL